MALVAALVEATPQNLLYTITQDGTGSPVGTTVNIPNDAGATPDLGTDALPGTPLRGLADRRRNTGVAQTQAQARALLLSRGAAGGAGGDFNQPRAKCYITAELVADGWGVDADVDAQGDPILTVFGPATTNAVALLHIDFEHSSQA